MAEHARMISRINFVPASAKLEREARTVNLTKLESLHVSWSVKMAESALGASNHIQKPYSMVSGHNTMVNSSIASVLKVTMA